MWYPFFVARPSIGSPGLLRRKNPAYIDKMGGVNHPRRQSHYPLIIRHETGARRDRSGTPETAHLVQTPDEQGEQENSDDDGENNDPPRNARGNEQIFGCGRGLNVVEFVREIRLDSEAQLDWLDDDFRGDTDNVLLHLRHRLQPQAGVDRDHDRVRRVEVVRLQEPREVSGVTLDI